MGIKTFIGTSQIDPNSKTWMEPKDYHSDGLINQPRIDIKRIRNSVWQVYDMNGKPVGKPIKVKRAAPQSTPLEQIIQRKEVSKLKTKKVTKAKKVVKKTTKKVHALVFTSKSALMQWLKK